MKSIEKILVPTDLSSLSLTAMDYAKSLAGLYKAYIYVLYVIKSVSQVSFSTGDLKREIVPSEVEENNTKKLEHVFSQKLFDRKNLIRVVRRGEPWKEIVKFANEESIDLIMMATHGRTGLAHFLMGSVAEKVVRHSPVPVFTVKPPQILEKLLGEGNLEEQFIRQSKA